MNNSVPVTYSFLGFGEQEVTLNTVKAMIDVIKKSAKNIRIRNKAADIVLNTGVEGKDQRGEVEAIYQFTREHTRYLKDPHGTEMIISPLTALDEIESGKVFQGDCDDLTILSLSLLKSIGYPVAIRIASYKPNGVFSHVYGLVKINGMWTPIESIVWDKPLGWEKEGAYKIQDYKIENSGLFSGFGEDNYIVYEVKAGDTLDAIAKRYGTTYQAIAKTNMIDDPNKIEVGQPLMIYTNTKPAAEKVATSLSPGLPMPTLSGSTNSLINYALAGGIVGIGVIVIVKMIQKNKQRKGV